MYYTWRTVFLINSHQKVAGWSSQKLYFIHENSKAPHVTGSRVLLVVESLWSCPFHRDFPSTRDIVVSVLESSRHAKVSNQSGGDFAININRVAMIHLKPQLRDSMSPAETMMCHSGSQPVWKKSSRNTHTAHRIATPSHLMASCEEKHSISYPCRHPPCIYYIVTRECYMNFPQAQ